MAGYIGLYIIYFITQIRSVHFVSVNGRASRVKSSKNKFWKEVGKKFLEKRFWEKNLKKNVLRNKFWKNNFRKKFWKRVLKKKNFFFNFEKFWKKTFFFKFEKQNFEKKMLKKKFGKINSKRKIFINKIYSNIDKCHTILALLAPFDRTGRKTTSNENVCGIWFKIGSVARSHWTQVMWRFERSRDKRYNHGFIGIVRKKI